jgi:hypothetical protein
MIQKITSKRLELPPIYLVENEDDFNYKSTNFTDHSTIDDSIYETCNNSTIVQFYHGLKPGEDLNKVIDWMKSEINKRELNQVF